MADNRGDVGNREEFLPSNPNSCPQDSSLENSNPLEQVPRQRIRRKANALRQLVESG